MRTVTKTNISMRVSNSRKRVLPYSIWKGHKGRLGRERRRGRDKARTGRRMRKKDEDDED